MLPPSGISLTRSKRGSTSLFVRPGVLDVLSTAAPDGLRQDDRPPVRTRPTISVEGQRWIPSLNRQHIIEIVRGQTVKFYSGFQSHSFYGSQNARRSLSGVCLKLKPSFKIGIFGNLATPSLLVSGLSADEHGLAAIPLQCLVQFDGHDLCQFLRFSNNLAVFFHC